jgi:hypothetical protein
MFGNKTPDSSINIGCLPDGQNATSEVLPAVPLKICLLGRDAVSLSD